MLSLSTNNNQVRAKIGKAILVAALFYGITFGLFFVVFQRLACPEDFLPWTCEVDDIVTLLGVAIACIIHASIVAIFAWTPLSAGLRAPMAEDSTSAFSTVLLTSVALDVMAFAQMAIIVEMKDIITVLQVLTISFNFPFLLAMPYLLAAYRDPHTNIGHFMHRIKSRIYSDSNSIREYEYESLNNQSPPRTQEDIDFLARLESAGFIISPQSRRAHPHSRSQSLANENFDEEEAKVNVQQRERMRPFPRFVLYVTSPNDAQPEP